MNKRNFTFLLALLFTVSSGNIWSQSLSGIESVEYDPINHRFLVTNSSSIVIVDGNGSPTGYFGSGAANYGMEVMGSALFGIYNSSVKAWDLTSGLQLGSVNISGAQFLNGMASDGNHTVWVTDFSAKKIHEIDFSDIANPVATEVVSNTVTTPNGICYDGVNNRLVFSAWGSSAKIKAVSLTDYSVTTLVTTTLSNIDGIDNDNNGNYYVSSWSPTRITKFSSEFSVNSIITAPGLGSPADICYAEEIDTIAIPNVSSSTVTFVGIDITNSVFSPENDLRFSCYPNPVSEKTVVSFTMPVSGLTRLEIFDAQGKKIKTLLDENLPMGEHKVLLAGVLLDQGSYIWSLTINGKSFTQPFMKLP
jgi:hypothetical protein